MGKLTYLRNALRHARKTHPEGNQDQLWKMVRDGDNAATVTKCIEDISRQAYMYLSDSALQDVQRAIIEDCLNQLILNVAIDELKKQVKEVCAKRDAEKYHENPHSHSKICLLPLEEHTCLFA